MIENLFLNLNNFEESLNIYVFFGVKNLIPGGNYWVSFRAAPRRSFVLRPEGRRIKKLISYLVVGPPKQHFYLFKYKKYKKKKSQKLELNKIIIFYFMFYESGPLKWKVKKSNMQCIFFSPTLSGSINRMFRVFPLCCGGSSWGLLVWTNQEPKQGSPEILDRADQFGEAWALRL